MAKGALIRTLGITASLLATCQALTWSVLSLMGILIYTTAWTPELEKLTTVQTWIFIFFLTDYEGQDIGDMIMVGDTMLGFMSTYFALSLIWMVVSLTMLWVVIREKWEFSRCTFITWGVLTAIISVLDIVAMALFASDFSTVNQLHKDYEIIPYSAVSAVGIMMTVAARGFALLIANIIFAVLFIMWSSVDHEKDHNEEPKREFINGFQQAQRPTWLANGDSNSSLGRPYSNPGYENDNQQQPRINSYNQNRFMPPTQTDSFGKLGRNNLRPYQNQQNQERGPYIPAPDYSPPSLQKHPKSVLKTRTHY